MLICDNVYIFVGILKSLRIWLNVFKDMCEVERVKNRVEDLGLIKTA